MIRQYAPTVSRCRMTETPRGTMQTGVVPVGTICRPHHSRSWVIVEAWMPRDYAAYRNGRFTTVRIRGGHLAQVRRLDNGQRFTLSDVWLLDAEERAA